MLVSKRFEKPVRKFRSFLKKAPKRPSIAHIRDLRTNARRSESIIAAPGPMAADRQRSQSGFLPPLELLPFPVSGPFRGSIASQPQPSHREPSHPRVHAPNTIRMLAAESAHGLGLPSRRWKQFAAFGR